MEAFQLPSLSSFLPALVVGTEPSTFALSYIPIPIFENFILRQSLTTLPQFGFEL